MGCFERNKRDGIKRPNCPLLGSHVWTAWATRGPHVATKQRPFGHFVPRAHRTRSSTVFGPPNSDYESVFELQIMTPICTMKTKKLCKNVEKSAQIKNNVENDSTNENAK